MNYRHIFHAGNFADVTKHITLLASLKNLQKKDSAFHVLDAFAGIGLYNLDSESANKSSEYKNGVMKLLEYEYQLPELLSEYKKIILKFYNDKNYPGSPIIISEMLRDNDRADFCELHPEDFVTLKKSLKKFHKNYSCHLSDGFLSSKSLLPPKEKRGLVLIDPPYEKKDEFINVFNSIEIISKRYIQSTILIWYPIKNHSEVKNFYSLISSLKREYMKIEFSIKDNNTALNNSGLIIINPPYIKTILEENLEFLAKNIYKGRASYTIVS